MWRSYNTASGRLHAQQPQRIASQHLSLRRGRKSDQAELRATQSMVIRVRIGRPSRAPQLTSAPFATTGIRHDELIHRLAFKP
jgi:hypothetical protein